MVQISIPSQLLQTYSAKCNLIYDVNVRALTKICGLDYPNIFKKHLLSFLANNKLNNNEEIQKFIGIFAPHVKNNKFVLELFNNLAKANGYIKNMKFLQEYQSLSHIQKMIGENKISNSSLSQNGLDFIKPLQTLEKRAAFAHEFFQNHEIIDTIDYQALLAKAMDDLMKSLKEKSLEELKKEKEKKYDDLIKEAIVYDDEDLEDESGEFSWEAFRKNVIWAALDKMAQEKTMADIGLSFGLTLAIQVPFNLLQNIHLQLDAIRKQRLKKTEENRNNHIANSLKQHGLNKEKLAILLAEDAHIWILDRPLLQGSTPFPKNKDNHFDFKRFSKKQKKKYIKLIKKYSKTTEWMRTVDHLCGLHLTKKEREIFLNAAIKQAFRVKPGSSRALTNKEFIEKLKEIHDKQANTLKQDAPQNNLLPIVSDEISQLIDKINNNTSLSEKEMRILEDKMKKNGATDSFMQTILSFPQNKKAIPNNFKQDIFEILSLHKIKNQAVRSYVLANKIPLHQIAKHGLQEQQNAQFIRKHDAYQQMRANHLENQRAS